MNCWSMIVYFRYRGRISLADLIYTLTKEYEKPLTELLFHAFRARFINYSSSV